MWCAYIPAFCKGIARVTPIGVEAGQRRAEWQAASGSAGATACRGRGARQILHRQSQRGHGRAADLGLQGRARRCMWCAHFLMCMSGRGVARQRLCLAMMADSAGEASLLVRAWADSHAYPVGTACFMSRRSPAGCRRCSARARVERGVPPIAWGECVRAAHGLRRAWAHRLQCGIQPGYAQGARIIAWAS
jgi:hypothetical protein